MRRFVLRAVVATALVASGWIVGRAQTPAPPTPDFEISVIYPRGQVAFTCIRGCQFAVSQVRNGVTTHGRIGSFTYGCGENAGPTCEYRTGGWVTR